MKLAITQGKSPTVPTVNLKIFYYGFKSAYLPASEEMKTKEKHKFLRYHVYTPSYHVNNIFHITVVYDSMYIFFSEVHASYVY